MNRWRGRGHRFVTEGVDGMTVWKGYSGANWWEAGGAACIWAAYQPKGAASFAASLVDLSGNGNNAGDPGGAATPPWDGVNGWKPDGAADYLTTTFTPQNDQSQSVLVQYTTCTNSGIICGMTGPVTAQLWIRPNNLNNVYYANGNGSAAVATALTAGNVGIAGNRAYRNGADEGAALAAYGAVPTFPVWIGGRNNSGVLNLPCAVYIQALAIYDCALTAPQVLAVATAMAAL